MKIPEIEISVKFKGVKKDELFTVTSSKGIYEACLEVFNADTIDWKEECIIFCLNKSMKIIGFSKVSSGGMDSTIVDGKIIFTIALKACASRIVVAHNHPSGTLRPSNQDVTITRKLKEMGEIMEIPVLDHIIVTTDGYYSFADNGIL